MKRSLGSKVFDNFNTVLMVFLMLLTIYPLLYVLFASLSNPNDLLRHRGLLFWPLGDMTLEGYRLVINNPSITTGYRNTIFYVGFGTLVNMVLTSLGAYVLSRKNFYLKNVMMIMMVITMFFDGGLIPRFFIVRELGMYNTVWSLIFPVAINAFNLIIMRTFFLSLPDSLEESALIEGANDLQVLTKIILPLSKPVIAVMILYYGVSHWNSWFQAAIYLRNRELYPLQLFLREILIASNTSGMLDADMAQEESLYRELIKYSTVIVSTLPILFVYPFLQKYFAKGVMIGAVKG